MALEKRHFFDYYDSYGSIILVGGIRDPKLVLLGMLERFIAYEDIVFVPQHTYFPVGHLSLKKQLLFPDYKDNADIGSLKKVKCKVNI